jgi:C4-dicarboxylate-specific signal transduction histidine kinase
VRFLTNWSIRTLLYVLVLISILPALGVVLYSGLEEYRHRTEDTFDDALTQIRMLSYQEELLVVSTRQLLITLAKTPQVQHQDLPACKLIFEKLVQENPVYSNILVVRLDGLVVAMAAHSPPFSIEKRKYFQDVLKARDFTTSEYIMGPASHRPVFPVAYPVLDDKGRLRAVLVAALDLQQFEKLFVGAKKLPEGSVLSIIDRNGVYAFRYPEHDKYVGSPDSPDMIKLMSGKSEEGVFRQIGKDGIKRIYAYKKFRLAKDQTPYLSMRVGVPEEKAFYEAKHVLFRNLAFLLAVLFLAVISANFLGNFLIARPIDKLVNMTKLVKEGTLGSKTNLLHSENELGALSKAMDEMSDELANRERQRRQYQEELAKHAKELEDVQKAYLNIMRDLERKNKELEETKQVLLRVVEELDAATKETDLLNRTLEEKVVERTRELQESTMQLIQAEKLIALGELTASVAHELKQPLNTIKIIGQSILRDIDKKRFDEQNAKDDLPEIILQVDRMSEIIDHMRVFTRRPIEAANEMVDLNGIIGDALKFVSQQLRDHNIEVIRDLDADLPKATGDSIRLEQVVINLINNARDAVEKSGTKEKRIEVRTGKDADGQAVWLEVKDNGLGIREDEKKKIFQPFFTTKEPGKGTGLGLSVSKKIIEEHKGTLAFSGNAGEGATFRFVLPVAS